MNIALVTYEDKGAYSAPNVENEDDLLIKFLSDKGLNIEKVIWNDPTVIWENYSLAILKSPWDYFNLIKDFYEWLEKLKNNNIKLLNPVDIVKWNADKHYLSDIENAELGVVKSLFLEKGDLAHLNDYFKELNTDQLIIKPCVSGGSKNTFKVTAANADEINEQLKLLLREESFIVQPFLKEIEEEGEWSFLFFGGKFSHALLKKAKKGDFRVQHSHGGTVHPQAVSTNLLQIAQEYVDQFAKGCLYARVDGVIVAEKFQLMELELIEPFLFLDSDPKSFDNYYKALKKHID